MLAGKDQWPQLGDRPKNLMPDLRTSGELALCFYAPLLSLSDVSLTKVNHYTANLMAFQCKCEKSFWHSDLRCFRPHETCRYVRTPGEGALVNSSSGPTTGHSLLVEVAIAPNSHAGGSAAFTTISWWSRNCTSRPQRRQ